MPEWSWPASLNFPALQTRLTAFFAELSMGPGSLYVDIVETPPDPAVHPEVEWDADVRLGDDLCVAERAFLVERKRVMKAAFARLFGVDEDEVDERDLPIVAIAGSGGGMLDSTTFLGNVLTVFRFSCDAEHYRLVNWRRCSWYPSLCCLHRRRVWYGSGPGSYTAPSG